MLVRIGESEKEPGFVNVRLVIVVIIQSISFGIHQKKCSACVLNLLLEYHWVGRPTHGCKWNFAGPQIYLQPGKIKSHHFMVSFKVLVCN